jgi:hypothetical protein
MSHPTVESVSPPRTPPVRPDATYEELLDADPEWAMEQGSRHFNAGSNVHLALRKITRRLDELGVAYAIVGGMALFLHGFRRFTEDVDVLVTAEGLRTIHANLPGRGWLPPFEGSKHLRDTEYKVKIEFIITGQYPGDGLPKPVAFPDPADVAVDVDAVHVLGIPTLVELKLASGMTSPDRPQDLVDVQRLIEELNLERRLADDLNEFVRPKFEELWDALHGVEKRYMTIWRNKWLTANATSIEEMALKLRAAADELEAMAADGVRLENVGAVADDYAHLVTNDRTVAAKYDMHDESEFLEESDESE